MVDDADDQETPQPSRPTERPRQKGLQAIGPGTQQQLEVASGPSQTTDPERGTYEPVSSAEKIPVLEPDPERMRKPDSSRDYSVLKQEQELAEAQALLEKQLQYRAEQSKEKDR